MNQTSIPEELRALRQWVIWRYGGDHKPTKIPHTTLGYRASDTNPDHWSTFGNVLRALARPRFADGIGFVFAADEPDKDSGIDYFRYRFDGCKVYFHFRNGEVNNKLFTIGPFTKRFTGASVPQKKDWFEEHAPAVNESTPSEKSPSTTGATGPARTGVRIRGTLADSTALPVTGNTAGDGWITQDTGHLWTWDAAAWRDTNDIWKQNLLSTPPATASTPSVATSSTVPASSYTVIPAIPACSESGSCYGDISDRTGRPKTVYVRGYYRRDGTYVRGYYRSK